MSRENDLEFVKEEYFNFRFVEEEVNEDEDFFDDSSDDEVEFDIEFEFFEFDLFERSRVEVFIRGFIGGY